MMDFIERIFGLSPDGGDGTVELMIVIGIVVVCVCVVASVPAARRRLLALVGMER